MAISLPIVSTFDNKGLKRARRGLQQFGNFAADVGKIAAGAVTAVAVAGVREAAAFESSIAKIEGLVGVGGDQLDELAAAARRLGPDFGKSANEAADALFFITSAGLRGDSAINVLEASLKGAAIGLGETKTIADLATSAVNAYGESQLDGAKAVDVLTEAVRLGKLEPDELAGALGSVLPVASNLGVRFDEVGAALAGMSKTGTDASTASTQLGQIFNALMKPTAEADQALADMGTSAAELRTQIREEGLFATLESLTDAFDGNIEATTEVFGNVRALRGVLDLMGASADDNREVFKLLADDTGVLDEAFAVTADTAQFKFDESMAQVKDTLLGIGTDLIERLIPHLETFQTFMEENGPQIEQIFDNIFAVVEQVADGVGQFITDLTEDEEFQEFLSTLQQWFIDTWPEVQELVGQLADLALKLTPLLKGAVEEALPTLSALVSILDDIAFFANEAAGGTDNFNFSLEDFIPVIGAYIGEDGLLVKFANGLDKIRDAYERLMAVGLDITPDFLKDLGGSVTLVPGSFTPGESGLTGDLPNVAPDHLGFRASGGPVMSGRPYIVGEIGPELFVPNQTGTIVPNNRLGGGPTYNITVQTGVGDPVRIGEDVVNAIKRYERASGPVFASA